MNDDIGSEAKWPLKDGGRKCVVCKHSNAACLGDFRDSFEVDDFHHWIGRGLGPDGAGFGANSLFECAGLGEVDDMPQHVAQRVIEEAKKAEGARA